MTIWWSDVSSVYLQSQPNQIIITSDLWFYLPYFKSCRKNEIWWDAHNPCMGFHRPLGIVGAILTPSNVGKITNPSLMPLPEK